MMTTFSRFCANCKMRHDFGDQIQVRYQHINGEDYDTWVSGNEVLGRMRSEEVNERISGLQNLNWLQIQEARERAKEKAESWLWDILADGLEENLGGNLFGDTLADAIRSEKQGENSAIVAKERWTLLLYDELFRAGVFELAWIQLEGSFPEEGSTEEPDDWI